MQVKRKLFSSALSQLLITYSLLTLIVSLIIGVMGFYYFSRNYNKSIEQLDRKLLEHVRGNIEELVLNKTSKVYLDLTDAVLGESVLYFFNYPLYGNYFNVANAHQSLQKLVNTNPDLIQSIFVYYRENNMLISSTAGLTRLDSGKNDTYSKIDWLTAMQDMPEKTLWYGTRLAPLSFDLPNSWVNIFSLVKTYPLVSSQSYKGFVAINLYETAISDIIQELAPAQGNTLFVIDGEGRVISHKDKSILNTVLPKNSYVEKILSSPEEQGSFFDRIDGNEQVVSYTSLANTGWKLVKVDSLKLFYSESRAIGIKLLIVCCGSILVGFLLSVLFSNRIYSPLRTILNTISRSYLSSASGYTSAGAVNEYEYIDKSFKNISVEINELRHTLDKNYPIIKYKLVNALFHDSMESSSDLEEYLNMLQMSHLHPVFCCAVLELDAGQLQNALPEQRHFIKYMIIEHFENQKEQDIIFLASEVSNTQIGVVVNAASGDCYAKVCVILEGILDRLLKEYFLSVKAGIGSFSESLPDARNSFRQAGSYLKYAYFLPERRLFYGEELIKREENSSELPDYLLINFESALENKNYKDTMEVVAGFAAMASQGPYSSEQCHQMLIRLIHILSRYTRNAPFSGQPREKGSLYHKFTQLLNIQDLQKWLSDYIRTVIKPQDSDVTISNAAVSQVVDYIDNHLASEISLEQLATLVYLEPTYLSRLFKNETGMTYSDYITFKRMELSKKLLLETRMKINDIALKSGYSNPSYFNMKFKAYSGMTPKQYRMSRSLKEPEAE